MVAFRSLVAVLVTVLTLFGGAFRAQTVLRAQTAIQSATDGAEQATLDADRPAVQGRATRPSTPDAGDGCGPSFPSSTGVRVTCVGAEATMPGARAPEGPHRRRVRPHAEHMVFLI